MSLPSGLDSTDLAILRAIASQPDIYTREIESAVYLSRSQVLRRLKRLEEAGLIIRRNGVPSSPYHYVLSPGITQEEIEQENVLRLSINRDPVAREALKIMLQAMEQVINVLSEATERIESILK